ncbi:Formamidopyrimidine-DNA glycosylase [Poriferisphaera corsica]|uniref:Formamidopyrimidine-DNA glycosylase n=1 Tax=Poriferisphaera corsica TaxID=2528020 RepID=A0A517YP43_9BACT|nr:bifunctional DNA-formamidopyrimidine glycosylase/DNA-(apurinic or apyrimidinic site) lyase [Poriferisphaera corsica]QDU31979.1 Formamidopyrimidine-DNA glycosylase [Poriferisphaera corsica]
MPELPEVENVVRSLTPILMGSSISSITLHRPDFLQTFPQSPPLKISQLKNTTITALHRRGKQFAIQTSSNLILVCHLGMTGQLTTHNTPTLLPKHTHLSFTVTNPNLKTSSPQRLIFRDPRRFGSLHLLPNFNTLLSSRWAALGPDALIITPSQIYASLKRTRRNLKAALLDQSLVAGLGNIYVDEILHLSKLSPKRRADRITKPQSEILIEHTQTVLRAAIDAGGSTLRDFVNGQGDFGSYQLNHLVYGKPSGHPCPTCGHPLKQTTLAGRTTVYCTTCQH